MHIFLLTGYFHFRYSSNMKTNSEIMTILRKARHMAGFARFIGMTRDGLKRRLSAPETARKNNLYLQYLLYLDYRAEKKGIK